MAVVLSTDSVSKRLLIILILLHHFGGRIDVRTAVHLFNRERTKSEMTGVVEEVGVEHQHTDDVV